MLILEASADDWTKLCDLKKKCCCILFSPQIFTGCKYLLALRDRIPAIRATFEKRTFCPDGCELFFPLSWKHSNETCFDVGTLLRCLGMLHKTGAPFKHLLYLSEWCTHKAPPAMNYVCISRALCPVLRHRDKPVALKWMHGNISRSCSVEAAGVLGSTAKWCRRVRAGEEVPSSD